VCIELYNVCVLEIILSRVCEETHLKRRKTYVHRNMSKERKKEADSLLRHTLQHTATHCTTLQHTATHCNTLQHTAMHCNTLQHTATHCNTLQHTATHCNILQHTATHRITLQHTATHPVGDAV